MKRVNNVYTSIYNGYNLYKAHINASRNKKNYNQVKMVNENTFEYINKIQKMLKTHTYTPSPYQVEIIQDRNKERELFKLPYYPDRIIQWAILQKIEKHFNSTFMFYTCASIKHRGIYRAYKTCKRYMRLSDKETKYCLKIDVKKFYPNIDQTILKNLLARKFKDRELLHLLNSIVDSFPKETGIPIGSYLSQFFANFYLSSLDHFLKEDLQMKYVIRYMDDMCIFHESKEHLHKVLTHIKEYISIVLNLKLKENYQIFPSNVRGVDFVGYRFFKGYSLVRKSTMKRAKQLFTRIKKTSQNRITHSDFCAANSYIGLISRANHFRFYERHIKPIVPKLVQYYHNNINHKKKASRTFKYQRSIAMTQFIIRK